MTKSDKNGAWQFATGQWAHLSHRFSSIILLKDVRSAGSGGQVVTMMQTSWAVGDFEAVEASGLNRIQQHSTSNPQQVQQQSVGDSRILQVSISTGIWFGTRGSEVQILSPRPFFQTHKQHFWFSGSIAVDRNEDPASSFLSTAKRFASSLRPARLNRCFGHLSTKLKRNGVRGVPTDLLRTVRHHCYRSSLSSDGISPVEFTPRNWSRTRYAGLFCTQMVFWRCNLLADKTSHGVNQASRPSRTKSSSFKCG